MNLHQTRSFDEVRAQVLARAANALPDQIVHVSDMQMTPEGHLVAPNLQPLRMNDWSRKQLASLVGVRWDKWFSSATPEERAEEVTRRLARTPGDLKVRAWRDDTGAAHGIARAFLAPSFTPIDDARYAESIVMRSAGRSSPL